MLYINTQYFLMEYKKKSLANLDIKKDYEEIDTRLASGWYVDDIHIGFKCNDYRKVIWHRHGSCGNLLNRLTHRSSHHLDSNKYPHGYYLCIDDDTIRGTFRNNRLLKRSVKKMDKLFTKQLLDYQKSQKNSVLGENIENMT